MKKLTAGIFATLLAVVSADGAYAAIASQGYVDDKVGEVSQTVTTLSGTVSGHTTQIAAKADSSTVTALAGRVSAVEAPKATVATGQTGPVSGQTVYNAIQGVSGNVGTVTSDVEGLKEDMTQAQTDISDLQEASATHATKSELSSGLAGKQDKLTQTGSASQPVYVNAEGKVTVGNTIPTVTTNITTGQTGAAQAGAVADALADKANTADLGALAKLNAVASAQITDGAVATADIANKAVTKEKLADEIVTSLDKADTALQQASLNGYLTKTAADAAYAGKTLETQVGTVSKENMGTTTATTVVAGVKEAIDAAKAADTKAESAASAASAAQSAAGTAQGDVDALEETVSEQGTRLTTAEGDIDTIQGQISNMATSEKVEGLQTTVTNLQSTKQDKTDNTLETTSKTVVGAINEVKKTADAKQDKLTGTIGGSMQPVYLNNGTITAGTALGTLATKNTVTNSDVADGALAQSKISGLAASLAAKLTTPPASEKGEDGLYVLTYDGTDFKWEDIVRTVAE